MREDIWGKKERERETERVYLFVFFDYPKSKYVSYDTVCYYNADVVPIAKQPIRFFISFSNNQYRTSHCIGVYVLYTLERYFQMMGKFMGSHRSNHSKMPRKQTKPTLSTAMAKTVRLTVLISIRECFLGIIYPCYCCCFCSRNGLMLH